MSSHKGKTLNNWNEKRMKGGMDEFKEGKLSLRQLSRAWNVPRITLHKHVKGLVTGHEHKGKATLFTTFQELELPALLSKLQQRGFRFSPHAVHRLAYQYAEENHIGGFSEEKSCKLSIRRPDALSNARAQGMNRPLLTKWFAGYERLMEELGIRQGPSHIWNCDKVVYKNHFLSKKS